MLQFDKPCNNRTYDLTIRYLGELTGIKWGFVRGGRKIRYVSSVELPLKFVHYSKGRKVAHDCMLFGKTEDVLKVEIRDALLKLLPRDHALYDYVFITTGDKYLTIMSDEARCSKFCIKDIKPIDAWLNGTDFVDFDDFSKDYHANDQPLGDW